MAAFHDLERRFGLVPRAPRRLKALIGLAVLLALSLFLWPRDSPKTLDSFAQQSFDGYEDLDVAFARADVLAANPGLELADDTRALVRLKGAGYIVDENGDHFYPDIHRPVTPLDSGVVVDPADVFSDIDAATHLVPPPKADVFPAELERNISLKPDPDAVELIMASIDIPADAFSVTWKPPDLEEKTGGTARKVQWAGFDGAHESDAEKAVREARRDAVRRGFLHTWQAYKDFAWGRCSVAISADNRSRRGATSVQDASGPLQRVGCDHHRLARYAPPHGPE